MIGEGKVLMLDLGEVQVIAEVKLNGQDLGILWKPSFAVDISDVVKPGKNQLEVKVTNLWPNRLIGDEQYADDSRWTAFKSRRRRGGALKSMPEWFVQGEPRPPGKQYTWTTWRHYSRNSKLLASGLIGPVVLRPAVQRAVPLDAHN